MDRLYKGIRKFQQTFYKQEQELFKKIGKGQSPDILFIACSDARVDPNLLTQSKPGDLFVIKNVGNMVPPNDGATKKTCTAAAVEFALVKLQITDVVVCGHSDCGALNALWCDQKDLACMDNLQEWIKTASGVKDFVLKHNHDPSYASKMEMTAKKHVIQQLENLKTYPLVAQAVKEEKLRLHGWYYEIGAGAVHAYNAETGSYERIECKCEEYGSPCSGDEECKDML